MLNIIQVEFGLAERILEALGLYFLIPGCSISFIRSPVMDQKGPSLSLDLCIHAGGGD